MEESVTPDTPCFITLSLPVQGNAPLQPPHNPFLPSSNTTLIHGLGMGQRQPVPQEEALTSQCCLCRPPPPRYLKPEKEPRPNPPPQPGCVPAGWDHGFCNRFLSSCIALLRSQCTCDTGCENDKLQTPQTQNIDTDILGRFRLQTASVISPVWVEKGQDKSRNQRTKWRNNIKNYRKQEEDRVGFYFLPPKKPVSSSDHTKKHGQSWILPASALKGLLAPRESMSAARTDKCGLLEIQTGARTSS